MGRGGALAPHAGLPTAQGSARPPTSPAQGPVLLGVATATHRTGWGTSPAQPNPPSSLGCPWPGDTWGCMADGPRLINKHLAPQQGILLHGCALRLGAEPRAGAGAEGRGQRAGDRAPGLSSMEPQGTVLSCAQAGGPEGSPICSPTAKFLKNLVHNQL